MQFFTLISWRSLMERAGWIQSIHSLTQRLRAGRRRSRALQMSRARKAQTALEYMMVLAVIVFPTGLALRELLGERPEGNGTQGKKVNIVQGMVKDAYGDERKMGVIGRPYP